MVMCVDLDVVGRILYYRCNLSRHSLLTFSNVKLFRVIPGSKRRKIQGSRLIDGVRTSAYF